jgi:predicted Zn finger-like uncharacterized protein
MDVRCERCRAQYVFDDDQVTPSGLTVQCTHCGHVFKVKKKELVVTVAVKPEELDRPPLPATAAAPRAAGRGAGPGPAQPDGAREWRVRQASGNLFTFRELTSLQKWIVEQKVGRDDEISASGDAAWRRLGDITELASFFQVVEAAERGRRPPPPPLPLAPVPPAPALRPLPPPVAPPAPPPVSIEVDLGPDDLAVVAKGSRAGRVALSLGALAALAGAAAYVYGPGLFPWIAPAQGPVPVLETPSGPATPSSDAGASPPAAGDTGGAPDAAEPVETEEASAQAALEAAPPVPAVAAPDAEASQIAAPVPIAEPAAPAPSPEPLTVVPAAVPAPPPAPPGPNALVAQATRLRERGEVDRALALYGRALELQPRNVAALTGRGLCYLDLETYPPAEASFEAALRVRPDDADALLGLAETYRWQGKRANAIRYYERYLAAHPAGEEANVAQNALEELRK